MQDFSIACVWNLLYIMKYNHFEQHARKTIHSIWRAVLDKSQKESHPVHVRQLTCMCSVLPRIKQAMRRVQPEDFGKEILT